MGPKCMICLENLFPSGVPVLVTPTQRYTLPRQQQQLITGCGNKKSGVSHKFHHRCLKEWFYQVETSSSRGCPLCRVPIFGNHHGAKLLRRDKLLTSQPDMISQTGTSNTDDDDDDDDTETVIGGETTLQSEDRATSLPTAVCHLCEVEITTDEHQVCDPTGKQFHHMCWSALNQERLDQTIARFPDLTLEEAQADLLLSDAIEYQGNGIPITEEFMGIIYQAYDQDTENTHDTVSPILVSLKTKTRTKNRYQTKSTVSRYNQRRRATIVRHQYGFGRHR